jgi:hypothetical protein
MRTFDRVRFQVQGGTGPNVGMSEIEVYALPSAPDAPRDVSAVPDAGGATVSWTAPDFDGGAPLTGYVVTPYDADGTRLEPVVVDEDHTSAKVGALTPGGAYRFTVTARSLMGDSPESAPSDPVTAGEGRTQ